MSDDRPDAWERAERVLAVRLDNSGDVLMTGPALRALRESGTERHVTLLTSPGGAEAGRLLPDVDEVWTYESPWMKASRPDDSNADFEMIDRLRAANFDAAAIFTVYSQSPLPAALLCLLAGVPRRLAHCRENPYQLLTDWLPEREPEHGIRHEVRRQLDLVAAVGCRAPDERMVVSVSPSARSHPAQLLADAGLDAARPWAVVHPGASAPSRRYPAEHFAQAVRQLVAEHGWQVVFTGGPDEVELVESIRASAHVPTHSLAGRLSLEELAGLLGRAPLLISNNTGPVHLAAGVGTPVVDLYALTNPQHTPWQVSHRVLYHDVPCRYCYKSICPEGHHDCLRLVSPDSVVDATLELAEETQLGRPAGNTT